MKVNNKKQKILRKTGEWNLNDLFKDNDPKDLSSHLDKGSKLTDKFILFKNTINQSITSKKLVKMLKEYEQLMIVLEKPMVYANLRFSKNNTDLNNRILLQKITSWFIENKNKTLFLKNKLIKLNNIKLASLIHSKDLSDYKHFLEKLLEFKPHSINENLEKLFNDKYQTSSGAFCKLYGQNRTLKLYDIKIKNRVKKMHETSIYDLLSDSSRSIRKAAFASISQGLAEDQNLNSEIYNAIIRDFSLSSKYFKFKNPWDLRHLENEVSDGEVESLVNSSEQHYYLIKRFYDLKSKVTKIKNQQAYDRSYPLSVNKDKIPFLKAKQIVLDSFGSMGKNYTKIAQDFFDKNWIDVKPQKGKNSGAFCQYSTPDHHPYILMNYSGKIRDVMTLAHELGHGINAVKMNTQSPLNFETPLILAETASVFSEMLVFNNLLETIKTKKEALNLLVDKIQDIIATVFRQASFYRFEQKSHKLLFEKHELSADDFSSIYSDEQNRMYKGSLSFNKDSGMWWAMVPHFFYTPFYVYSYSFGMLISVKLYAQFLKNPRSFIPKYLKFLSAGNSDSPQELLKPFGIDMKASDTWDEAFGYISSLLSKASRIHNSLIKKA
jgi:oligoendopeptidase F